MQIVLQGSHGGGCNALDRFRDVLIVHVDCSGRLGLLLLHSRVKWWWLGLRRMSGRNPAKPAFESIAVSPLPRRRPMKPA